MTSRLNLVSIFQCFVLNLNMLWLHILPLPPSPCGWIQGHQGLPGGKDVRKKRMLNMANVECVENMEVCQLPRSLTWEQGWPATQSRRWNLICSILQPEYLCKRANQTNQYWGSHQQSEIIWKVSKHFMGHNFVASPGGTVFQRILLDNLSLGVFCQ